MIRQYWKPAVAIVAALVLGVGATVFAYGRSHPAQVALIHATPSGQASNGSLYVPGAGYGYGASPPGTTPYPGYPYPTPYSLPYPGYAYNPNGYATQRGTGIGPPHAGSIADLGSPPGCDETSTVSGYGSGYGACVAGVYQACLYDPASPYCNQTLSNGTTCGYGAAGGCIAVQLSCRLPIFGGGPGSGGFITLPLGGFTTDPSSNVSLPGNGYPGGGATYDRAVSRWVPVQWLWLSPDGQQYTYTDQSGAIHSVDVASGTDKTLTTSGSWQPLRYTTEGIYAVQNGPAPGLWLVAAGASPKQITASGYWNFIGGGAAYGNVSASYPSGASNQVLRLDLKTATSTPWFERPGYFSSVVGVDLGGHAVVQVSSYGPYQQTELWLAVSAGLGIKLLQGFNVYSPTLSDSRGLWIGSNGPYTQGTFLLTTLTDTNGIAHNVYDRVSPVTGQFAGDCAG